MKIGPHIAIACLRVKITVDLAEIHIRCNLWQIAELQSPTKEFRDDTLVVSVEHIVIQFMANACDIKIDYHIRPWLKWQLFFIESEVLHII